MGMTVSVESNRKSVRIPDNDGFISLPRGSMDRIKEKAKENLRLYMNEDNFQDLKINHFKEFPTTVLTLVEFQLHTKISDLSHYSLACEKISKKPLNISSQPNLMNKFSDQMIAASHGFLNLSIKMFGVDTKRMLSTSRYKSHELVKMFGSDVLVYVHCYVIMIFNKSNTICEKNPHLSDLCKIRKTLS
jgi:hypothetical protein